MKPFLLLSALVRILPNPSPFQGTSGLSGSFSLFASVILLLVVGISFCRQ